MDVNGTTIVELEGVVRVYSDSRAVGPVDLAVQEGECVALMGANGAGKSTMMRIVGGADRPDAGTVRVLGLPPRPHDLEFRRRVLVLDEVSYFPDLSVREHLQLVAVGHGLGADSDHGVAEALEQCRLTGHADISPYKLSKGLQQLMSIAALLIPPRPALLVTDEPERHLDESARSWLGEALAAKKREGAAILLASHSGDLVRAVADRVLAIGEESEAVRA